MNLEGLKLETFLSPGTPAFRRANAALFAAGFATFALLYSVQPLLPVFVREFHVSAAESSLVLSGSTLTLAVSLLVASSLSEAWGRKRVMVVSLGCSAGLTLLCAVAPGWSTLLGLRAGLGVALSGLPAVAMGYLSEEVEPAGLGLATGLLIGGNALGGMAGRLLCGVLTDLGGWRLAFAGVGVLSLVVAVGFARALPPSRHFSAQPLAVGQLAASLAGHLRDPGLRWLFALSFLLMGAFVTAYNYLGFRLQAPPFGLSQSASAAVFAVYLVGIAASAWFGDLAGRRGRRHVQWVPVAAMLAGVGLTLAGNLSLVVLGVATLTGGFFGAHSIASSWVGRRARGAKAQASALYLFCYYAGASAVGSAGGFGWTHAGWPGVAATVGGAVALALAVSVRLAFLLPRADLDPAVGEAAADDTTRITATATKAASA